MTTHINILSDSHDGFAGHVLPGDCWQMLQDDETSYLIDVRTRAEWQFVGVPDLAAAKNKLICIEWQGFPDMNPNPDFVATVMQMIKPPAILFLLCRSGQRSQAAARALTFEGFTCYNVAGGFEGDLDDRRHRATMNGWQYDNCPWQQH